MTDGRIGGGGAFAANPHFSNVAASAPMQGASIASPLAGAPGASYGGDPWQSAPRSNALQRPAPQQPAARQRSMPQQPMPQNPDDAYSMNPGDFVTPYSDLEPISTDDLFAVHEDDDHGSFTMEVVDDSKHGLFGRSRGLHRGEEQPYGAAPGTVRMPEVASADAVPGAYGAPPAQTGAQSYAQDAYPQGQYAQQFEPMAVQGAAPMSADAAYGRPSHRGGHTSLIVVLAAVLVVLVVVGVGLGFLSKSKNDPTGYMNSYLDALNNGKYGTAASMEAAGVPDAQRVLLKDGIIADPSKRISNAHVTSSMTDGDRRLYGITYQLGSLGTAQGTAVIKKTGSFVFATWSFDGIGMLSGIDVPADGPTITINGQSITPDSNNADMASRAGTVSTYGSDGNLVTPDHITALAYPGVYTVGVADGGNQYYTVDLSGSSSLSSDSSFSSGDSSGTLSYSGTNDGDKITVTTAMVSNVSYALEPTDALAQELTRQTSEHLASCVDNINAKGADDPTCYLDYSTVSPLLTDGATFDAQIGTEPNISVGDISFDSSSGALGWFSDDASSIAITISEGGSETEYESYSFGFIGFSIDGDAVTIMFDYE